jgi:hypothetical protein
MTFKFDEDYRASDEYKAWVAGVKADFPTMPLYLIEQAIMAHKTDPQAYKKDKNSREVFKQAPKVRVNDKQQVLNSITVQDAPIEPIEEASVTIEVEEPSDAVVIEEVEA